MIEDPNIPEEHHRNNFNMNITLPTDSPTIDDLVGKPKELVENILEGLKNEQLFYMMASNPDKIFVVHGPPGTGKTFSIKALNNTANRKALKRLKGELPELDDKSNPFGFSLMMFSYDIGRYGTAYINMGSRNVQQFFDGVYIAAQRLPVLVQLDEADALLSKRGGIHTHKEDDKVLETLMKNLQTAHDTPGVYVVMMTNLIQGVDEAVLRAGRVDRNYTFGLPTQDERQELLYKIIQNKNDYAGYKVIRNYDISELAKITEGFNTADISAIIDKTLKNKVRKVIKTREPGIIPASYVTQKSLEDEIKYHKKEFKKEERKHIGYL